MKHVLVRTLIAFVATACSSTSSTTVDSGASSLTSDQACADNAHATCTHLQMCSPTSMQLRYGDEAACEMRTKVNCVNALAAPSNGNDAAKTEGCAQAYAGWACTDFLNGENVPRACQQATGSTTNGSVCAFPGQCLSGFCAIVPGSACGTCAAPPAAGASCAQLTACGQGLVCTGDTQTCVVPGASGAACGKGAFCGAGLSCVGANAAMGTMGTCQTAVAQSGSACDPTQRTGAGCDRNAGLVCNASTKQCAAVILASGGAACNDVNSQNTPCSAGGQCSTTMPGTMGTCTAAAADGAPCDLASGPPCAIPARCVLGSDGGTAGTCQLPNASSCQ